MINETQPTTIRISPETYQKLKEYSSFVNAKDISSIVRFFLLTFLESPDNFPNIEMKQVGKACRQTTIAIDLELLDQLKNIAQIRNVSLAYLLRLAIFYGLRESE